MAVRYEVDGGVVTVTIDRPEVRNAVNSATAAELAACFRRFESDESLSVAVLTGAGGTFCAGFDLKELASAGGDRLGAPEGGPMGPTLMLLGKPVIAAVEGYAVAGGFELALWCDLRVAARGATFGVFNRRFGVPLIDLGTVRLPRMIGEGRALDLILTGRPVSGQEAYEMGLVQRLVADGQALAEAQALARKLVEFPQGAMRGDRMSAKTQWGRSLDEAAREERRLGLDVLQSGESTSGAARFSAGAGRHGRQ
jgi:enoyl-CoA hydratase